MTNTNYPSATPSSQPPAPRNRNSKNLLIGILAACLLGSWGYVLWHNSKTEDERQVAKTESVGYLSQRDSLKLLYDDAVVRLDSLTGANNNLQSDKQRQMEADKKEIARILNDRNATANDLQKARTMITNLNSQISTLQAENARLNGENQVLTANNTQLSTEKQVLEQNLQTSTLEKEELSQTIDVGSTFSASNIQITPVNEKSNGKEKTTTTAKRVDKLVVSFDVENRIARSGPADMYIIVTGPNGQVVSDASLGSSTLSTRTDGDKSFTTRVPVDYSQGTRQPVSFSIRQSDFQTGNYRIEVYHNGFKIGEGVRTLKKGGLFG
ncbi:MAG: hypothetical protein ABW019_10555 [Chitinophagaceae bacterium]